MRNSYDRNSRSMQSKSWIWWWWALAIIVLIFITRIFSSSWNDENLASLLITPLPESTVYISMNNSSKARISEPEKLYASDKSVSVQVWWAKAENSEMYIDIDKTSELTYKESTLSGNTIGLEKWRAWVQTIKWTTTIELKYMDIVSPVGTTLIVEQNNLSSTIYMIAWSSLVETKIWTYTLNAGNKMMIAWSDLSNPWTVLASLTASIDDSIVEHPLFVRNDGKNILQTIKTDTLTATGETISESSTGNVLNVTGKYIEVTDPLDGSLIKNSTFAVMGNTLSKEVRKVTINDIPATLSPVNQTFVLQNISLTSDIVNLVYKAYWENDKLLERWVLSVFWSKNAITSGNAKLIPDNFPASNKDFPITFPSDNPYKTTDSLVRVEWSVPANTVSYIMVNDYRLQKFISWGTKWYYFANTATETMKEGINLYNIRFYTKDNTLLYTQVFTIVKESKNATVSGEIIQ